MRLLKGTPSLKAKPCSSRHGEHVTDLSNNPLQPELPSLCSRRTLLLGMTATCVVQCPKTASAASAAAFSILSGPPAAVWLQPPPGQASIPNPGLSWAMTDAGRQLYYPDWLLGTWSVSAKLKAVGFPQGQRLVNRDTPGVTKGSMIVALADVGAGMEAPATWQCRFVQSARGVVADRVFNTTQQANVTLQYPAVKQVDYQPDINPTRMSVVYATPRRGSGAQPDSVDLRKAEIFINNRGREDLSDGRSVITWEMIRQVNQAARQGSVGDYLVVTQWAPEATGSVAVPATVQTVRADMRVAAFLQPQEAAYFEAGGKAVAIYDYTLVLTRTDNESDNVKIAQ